MAECDFDKEYDAAVKAAALSDKTEPRAAAACYARRENRSNRMKPFVLSKSVQGPQVLLMLNAMS
jgi:hypothetical protein